MKTKQFKIVFVFLGLKILEVVGCLLVIGGLWVFGWDCLGIKNASLQGIGIYVAPAVMALVFFAGITAIVCFSYFVGIGLHWLMKWNWNKATGLIERKSKGGES